MKNDAAILSPNNPLAALRQLARPRPAPREHCDLCAAVVSPHHAHLIKPASRQIICACDACALLFDNPDGAYRRIPERSERWDDFAIADEQWEALGVPIALAFFFYSSACGQAIAMYPSPGGATEAALPGEVWQLLCEDNPALARLRPDVEALLVNRLQDRRHYYRVPIDECFRLVGLIRSAWRGLSGGKIVWQNIQQFFDQLNARCAGASHA